MEKLRKTRRALIGTKANNVKYALVQISRKMAALLHEKTKYLFSYLTLKSTDILIEPANYYRGEKRLTS